MGNSSDLGIGGMGLTGTAKSAVACDSLTSGSTLVTEIITTTDGFLDLAEAWQGLQDNGRCQVPFHNHAWLRRVMAMHTNHNQPLEPYIIAARRAGEVVFILPLMIVRKRGLAVAQWLGDPLFEYGDGLAAQGLDIRVAFADALRTIRNDGRIAAIHLRKVPDSAVIAPALSGRARVLGEEEARYIDLTSYDSIEDWRQTLNPKTRKSRRRRAKKLQELGTVSFEIVQGGNEARQLMEAAIQLKADWMKENGLVSRTFMDQTACDRLIDLAEDRKAGIVMSALRVEGKLAAVEAGCRSGYAYYSYIGAMAPEFAAYGPGNIQLEATLDWAIGEGLKWFDLLAPADPYKASWAAQSQRVCDYALPLGLAGRAYVDWFLGRLRPLAKATFENTPELLRKKISDHLLQAGEA